MRPAESTTHLMAVWAIKHIIKEETDEKTTNAEGRPPSG